MVLLTPRPGAIAIVTSLLSLVTPPVSAYAVAREDHSWSSWSPALPSFPLPNTTIYDFGLGIWPENLNVRPNGQILVTTINRPEVFQINPFKQQDGVIVHTFEGKASTLGIVETFPDVFHVLVGDFITHPAFGGVTGSFGVWELDFTARSVDPNALAVVTHIVDVPEAEILDGMEVLNSDLGLVLVSDCKAGVVYTVDVKAKTAKATVNSPLFYSTSALPIGIDGIKLFGSYIYYTNAAYAFFGRIPIDLTSGYATGPVERLPVQLEPGPADDFIFDKYGNAWLSNAAPNATQGMYLVPKPAAQSKNVTFVSSITGPTAARFGKTKWDEGSLYVTSTGGDFAYPPQNFTVSSKLSRIDIYLAEEQKAFD